MFKKGQRVSGKRSLLYYHLAVSLLEILLELRTILAEIASWTPFCWVLFRQSVIKPAH